MALRCTSGRISRGLGGGCRCNANEGMRWRFYARIWDCDVSVWLVLSFTYATFSITTIRYLPVALGLPSNFSRGFGVKCNIDNYRLVSTHLQSARTVVKQFGSASALRCERKWDEYLRKGWSRSMIRLLLNLWPLVYVLLVVNEITFNFASNIYYIFLAKLYFVYVFLYLKYANEM